MIAVVNRESFHFAAVYRTGYMTQLAVTPFLQVATCSANWRAVKSSPVHYVETQKRSSHYRSVWLQGQSCGDLLFLLIVPTSF